MQPKHTILPLLVTLLLLTTGCKKYLTVQPEAAYTDPQVFTNEKAIQQALNGLYNALTSDSLYGANLSTTSIELMGQRYNAVSTVDNNYLLFQQYGYNQSALLTDFDALWHQAYLAILSANKFISAIDGAAAQNVLTRQHADQVKGEAIALRAFVHFDMLRLYGPVYATNASSPAIPYYRQADGQSRPIISATAALDSVLTDFTQAETLLSADPIITNGIVNSADFYSGSRNQRLNYYAVKGLMARAYLWGGNTSAAHDSAQAVLTQAEKWLPWLPKDSIVSSDNPDRIFSTELLFGLYNQQMYTNYTTYFSPTITDQDILAAQPARLNVLFENNQNDFRFTTTWLNTIKTYRTFFKFADAASDITKPWRFIQPLVRKTEMYYIIAETETQPSAAFAALDTVLHNRNLPDLALTAVLNTEIEKEYQKEFWGEGQLFYYYKRRNLPVIPSGVSGTANITMSDAQYVVPLPLSETTPR